MPRDVLAIVQEYLRAEDEQVRKNAVVALATIGSRDSLLELIRIALDNSDPRVRDLAIAEIVTLPDPAASQLTQELRCSVDISERGKRAYALLGQLKSQGMPLDFRHMSPLERIRLAVATTGMLDPTRGGPYRWRLALPGLLGAVLGFSFFAAFLTFALKDHPGGMAGSVQGMLMLSLLLTPVLAVAASRRANPVHLQPDTPAALVVESGGAFLGALIPSIVLLFFFGAMLFADAADTAMDGLLSLLGAFFLVALLPATVRLGTILGCGLSSRPLWNRVIQSLVGTAAGIVSLTVGALASDYLPDGRLWVGGETARLLWLVLLPSALGLGLAFATVDRAAPERMTRPFAGRVGYYASALLIVLLVLPVVLLIGSWKREQLALRFPTGAAGNEAAFMSHSGRDGVAILRTVGDSAVWRSGEVPRTLQFRVTPAQSAPMLHTVVTADAHFTYDLSLELRAAAGDTVLAEAYKPSRVLQPLAQGLYTVTARDERSADMLASPATEDEILMLLSERLAQSWTTPDSNPAGGESERGVRIVVRAVRQSTFEALQHADRGQFAARSDSIDAAIRSYELATSIGGASVLLPEHLNTLCWRGSLLGPATAARVLPYCEQAVAADPANVNFRDSRGLALALTGARDEAISDFEAYLGEAMDSTDIAIRRQWIATLRTRALDRGDLEPITGAADG